MIPAWTSLPSGALVQSARAGGEAAANVDVDCKNQVFQLCKTIEKYEAELSGLKSQLKVAVEALAFYRSRCSCDQWNTTDLLKLAKVRAKDAEACAQEAIIRAVDAEACAHQAEACDSTRSRYAANIGGSVMGGGAATQLILEGAFALRETAQTSGDSTKQTHREKIMQSRDKNNGQDTGSSASTADPPSSGKELVTVTLMREGAHWQHVGMTVSPDYKVATLKVDKVWEPSLVSQWNHQNPQLQVSVGDLIKSVNGVSDSAEDMIVQLSRSVKGSTIEIVIE